MSDIKVTESLKERTMARCTQKRHINLNRYLATAACLLLIIGLVRIAGPVLQKPFTQGTQTPGTNIALSSTEGNPEMFVQDTAMPKDWREWQLASVEEAQKSFGEGFLTPVSIPDAFKLSAIHVSGLNRDDASRVVISFSSSEKLLTVIEQKIEKQSVPAGYEVIDIDGTTAYLKEDPVNKEGVDTYTSTDVQWYGNGVHYTVTGNLSKDEAIGIASSMNKDN